jgi:flagellar secretion chaperone FliS
LLNTAQQSYRNIQAATVPPGELTLMLYNGCVRFIKQAIANLDDRNYEQKNISLKKAQNIIDELIITLNMEYDISKQLRPLYLFIKQSLIEANIKNDNELLVNCLELSIELRDTWEQALKLIKSPDRPGTI